MATLTHGQAVAQLLLAENCTDIIANSKSKNLPIFVLGTDLIIGAVGRP